VEREPILRREEQPRVPGDFRRLAGTTARGSPRPIKAGMWLMRWRNR